MGEGSDGMVEDDEYTNSIYYEENEFEYLHRIGRCGPQCPLCEDEFNQWGWGREREE